MLFLSPSLAFLCSNLSFWRDFSNLERCSYTTEHIKERRREREKGWMTGERERKQQQGFSERFEPGGRQTAVIQICTLHQTKHLNSHVREVDRKRMCVSWLIWEPGVIFIQPGCDLSTRQLLHRQEAAVFLTTLVVQRCLQILYKFGSGCFCAWWVVSATSYSKATRKCRWLQESSWQ